jgi:hypothetical protein
MRSTLVDRIQSQAADRPLHRAFGRAARELYALWAQRSAPEVVAELCRALDSDPGEVDALLDAYAGEGSESSEALSGDAEISGEAYDAIAKVIDPEIVAAALVRRHGPDLGSGDFYRHDSSNVAERIGHQFLWMHQRALRELAEQAAAAAASDADALWSADPAKAAQGST